jgi:hypothetical protein
LKTLEKKYEKQTKSSTSLFSHSIVRRDFLTKGLMLGTGVMGLSLLGGKFPAPTPTLHAQFPLAMTDQLHACTRATDGQLFHTIRFASSWQSFFGNVNAQESNGNSLRFSDVDCSGIGGNLHVTAIAKDGTIWHTIRFASSWQSFFGNVNAQESNGSLLRFSEVSCAGTANNNLHVTAIDQTGIIWHTIRFASSWQSSFGNVNAQESNGNSLRFSSVDCATIGDDLHVTAVDQTGIIWHTIRFSNGTWVSGFGNVNNQESNGSSLRFSNVGCAAIGDNLHVTAVDQNGTIWHTIRFSNGSWQSFFGSVNAQESNGSNLRFSDVDCANVGDNLHVTAIDQTGISWHTIRFSSSWQSSFGNVNAQESNGNSLRFSAIGAGGIV